MWIKKFVEKVYYEKEDVPYEENYNYILDGFDLIKITKVQEGWCGLIGSKYYRDKNNQWAVTKGEVISSDNLNELKILCLIKAKELGWDIPTIKI